MRKKTIWLLALAMLALNGCSSIATLPVPVQDVKAPAGLMIDCFAPAALGDDTMGSLATGLIANTAALNDCAEKHRLLVEWVAHQ